MTAGVGEAVGSSVGVTVAVAVAVAVVVAVTVAVVTVGVGVGSGVPPLQAVSSPIAASRASTRITHLLLDICFSSIPLRRGFCNFSSSPAYNV